MAGDAVTKTLGDYIREVVADADKRKQSRVQAVLDYMAEKDSHITREEAKRLIWLHVNPNREVTP